MDNFHIGIIVIGSLAAVFLVIGRWHSIKWKRANQRLIEQNIPEHVLNSAVFRIDRIQMCLLEKGWRHGGNPDVGWGLLLVSGDRLIFLPRYFGLQSRGQYADKLLKGEMRLKSEWAIDAQIGDIVKIERMSRTFSSHHDITLRFKNEDWHRLRFPAKRSRVAENQLIEDFISSLTRVNANIEVVEDIQKF